MTKRIFALLLALVLVLPMLAACSESGTNEEKTAGAADGGASADAGTPEVQEEEPEIGLDTAKLQYADRNYNGYSYRIADRASGDWMTFDVYSSEITGEVINDSVFNRNTVLEDTMNIKIVEVPFDGVTSNVKTSITSGTDDYDTFTDGLNSLAPLITQHMILDFNDVPTIHPENAWWDQALYKELSVGGGAYMMTGDISVMDNYGTWCYLFNKQLITDYSLENPYDLVDSGKWTLDKHNEMAEVATRDTDGDGKWTMADTYGYVTETYNNIAMWTCFGYKICEKDENDIPYYTYDGERQVSALMRIIEAQYAPFSNMGSKSTVTGGGSFQDNTRENQFAIGRALFYYAGMRNITLFREADTDFGIIPAPKEDETQKQYYSSYSIYNLTAYALPVTITDIDKVGDITEAMAHLSVYTLTPAYYDQTLIGKSTRDVESEPMIALIMSTRNFDLGIAFDWGSVFSTICGMTDPTVVTSKFASSAKVANKALDKFLKSLDD
ncbi:MAG: hypothetical protein II889_02860 [Clostridia bacterium]|nr:hypothetical protein [Clostridia bacterium]